MRRENGGLNHKNLFIKKMQGKFETSQIELLNKAYAFSRVKGIETSSLSFKAAELILEYGADADTIAAAMLAQALWDGNANRLEIRKEFGNKVVSILDGFKPSYTILTEPEPNRGEGIRALLGSLAKTPHKAILLIAFRFIELDNGLKTNTVDSRPLAQETIDLYVPIANQLSLGGLRRRLEDMCFHILEPVEYEALKLQVAPMQAEDNSCLKLLTKGVRRLLNKKGLQAELKARIKSLYGIRHKMIRTGKSLNEIIDRLGMRIIVASVPECYTVLGLLHTHFKPISGTFDDYIGLPKDNGYQSLHTCVYPVRGISHKPIEFQVRTKLMHMEAEHGCAAHWLYKNEMFPPKGVSQKQWMKGLLHQQKRTVNTDEFIEMLHRQIYADHLVIFSNGGRIMRLPDKATVQDYLDKFSIRCGQSTVVRVNGKVAGMDWLLQDGDSIGIIKSDKLQPQETASARFKADTRTIDEGVRVYQTDEIS
jgi:(p)ppGpp synthase/HD superfamily hydrolase